MIVKVFNNDRRVILVMRLTLKAGLIIPIYPQISVPYAQAMHV